MATAKENILKCGLRGIFFLNVETYVAFLRSSMTGVSVSEPT